eukprot:gene5412-7146_t
MFDSVGQVFVAVGLNVFVPVALNVDLVRHSDEFELIHDKESNFWKQCQMPWKTTFHVQLLMISNSIVGLAFRRVAFPLFVGQDDRCFELLELCFHCFKSGYLAVVSANSNYIIVALFEDAFDLLPLHMCEKAFTVIEQHAQEPAFAFANSPRIVRMINGLKTRLSRSRNLELSGRLLIFLARLHQTIFRLSDKSGANMSSSVNASNKTEYDETDEELSLNGNEAAKADDTVTLSSIGRPLNKDHYKKFWTLQRFFCQPQLCYDSEQWHAFSKSTECVLDLFRRHPLEDIHVHTDDSAAIQDTLHKEPTHLKKTFSDTVKIDSADATFAKYLTSPKLFELQLHDVTMRREILLQLLILFAYLPRQSKFKQRGQVPTPSQLEWLNIQKKEVEKLMKTAGSNGDWFLRSAKHFLQREMFWLRWKEEGCPSYEITETVRPSRIIDDTDNVGTPMGSKELQRLWTISSTNKEACKRAKVEIPSLEAYFADAIGDMDPDQCVEEMYWKTKNVEFNWKGLRLIARHKVNLLNFNDQSSLEGYMESTMRTLAKDIIPEENELKKDETK